MFLLESFLLQTICEQLSFPVGAHKCVLRHYLWERVERIARQQRAFSAPRVIQNMMVIVTSVCCVSGPASSLQVGVPYLANTIKYEYSSVFYFPRNYTLFSREQ